MVITKSHFRTGSCKIYLIAKENYRRHRDPIGSVLPNGSLSHRDFNGVGIPSALANSVQIHSTVAKILILTSILPLGSLWTRPVQGATPPSICEIVLAKGKRFHTIAVVPDPGVPNGARLYGELVSSEEWYAEGYGFQPYVLQLPVLSEQLGIGVLPPVPNSPASEENVRLGDATGYRFYYPEVWTLNIRMDQLDVDGQIPIRFHPVQGLLSSLEVLMMLAHLRMPYASDGSSHFHDLQIHLYGAVAVPKFWWDGVQDRAQFITAIAEQETFLSDPVLNETVLAMAHGLTHDVEYVTSDFPRGVLTALAGTSEPRNDTHRAKALSDLLKRGGTGGNYPTMGTKSLAKDFIKLIKRAEQYLDRKINPTIKRNLLQFIAQMNLTDDPIFPEPMEILRQARANLRVPERARRF